MQEDLLKPLLVHCEPAPFGDGTRTRYDRTVRDALQRKAEGGAFSIENFDPESSGILRKIQRELLPHDPNPILAELYSVNIYCQGGHFAPHKDTPRGNSMFGTLVVCLPSQFAGGTFVLKHMGVVQKLDWGNAIAKQKKPNQIHWAAFFGDVDHQIERVWAGARVTLTYLLRRSAPGIPLPSTAASEGPAPRVLEAWQALLGDKRFLPKGGTLAYPCCHLYHHDARFQVEQRRISRESVTMLKGRDHLVAATALQYGLQVTFQPYMFENCADETWQLNRFPTSAEQARLRRRRQMDSSGLKAALPIVASSEQEGDFDVTWLEPPPSSDKSSRSEEESELPVAAHLHSCEYCPWGYFGNEASDVDLYTYAALHVEIPPWGKGPRVLAEPTKKTSVKRRPTTRQSTKKKK
jgi:hypothetical protein